MLYTIPTAELRAFSLPSKISLTFDFGPSAPAIKCPWYCEPSVKCAVTPCPSISYVTSSRVFPHKTSIPSAHKFRSFFLDTRFMPGALMLLSFSPVSLLRSSIVSSAPRSCVGSHCVSGNRAKRSGGRSFLMMGMDQWIARVHSLGRLIVGISASKIVYVMPALNCC